MSQIRMEQDPLQLRDTENRIPQAVQGSDIGRGIMTAFITDFDTYDEFREQWSNVIDIKWESHKLIFGSMGTNPVYIVYDGTISRLIVLGTTNEMEQVVTELTKADHRFGAINLSPKGIEEVLSGVADEYDHFRASQFTGQTLPGVSNGTRRDGFDRSVSYYGKDAWPTYEEMAEDYGISLKSIQVLADDSGRATIRENGYIMWSDSTGLTVCWQIVDHIESLVTPVIDGIRTGGPEKSESSIMDVTFDIVVPYRISFKEQFTSGEMEKLEHLVEDGEGELSLSEFRFDNEWFDGEIIDTCRYSRTAIRTKGANTVRVYPREELGIATQIRIYNVLRTVFGEVDSIGKVE